MVSNRPRDMILLCDSFLDTLQLIPCYNSSAAVMHTSSMHTVHDGMSIAQVCCSAGRTYCDIVLHDEVSVTCELIIPLQPSDSYFALPLLWEDYSAATKMCYLQTSNSECLVEFHVFDSSLLDKTRDIKS